MTRQSKEARRTPETESEAPAVGYTAAAAAQILDLSEARLRAWASAGLVAPSLRRGDKRVYSFQDLVSLKAAKELVERGFSTTQIRRALTAVRASLPEVGRPLERLRVAWDGQALVIVDDGAAFELTGQRVFDFGLGELEARATSVAAGALPRRRPPAAALKSGFQLLKEGLEAERAGRDDEAGACYRRALEVDPGLSAAQTNLGTLAYRRGELAEARSRFEAALGLDPEQAEARYNLASLLYEGGQCELAAAELKHVLELRPDFADAHYNLATALERLGGRGQARAHLLRFLELATEQGEESPFLEEARARLARLV